MPRRFRQRLCPDWLSESIVYLIRFYLHSIKTCLRSSKLEPYITSWFFSSEHQYMIYYISHYEHAYFIIWRKSPFDLDSVKYGKAKSNGSLVKVGNQIRKSFKRVKLKNVSQASFAVSFENFRKNFTPCDHSLNLIASVLLRKHFR